MNLIELARKLRPLIEKAAQSLDDSEASEAAELFGKMAYDGKLIHAGTKINWNGVVKQAAVDLWDNEWNNPEKAPALWNNLAYKDGIRYIPETIQATEAFALGERGWWKEELYESLIAANIYTPEQYGAGWKLSERS